MRERRVKATARAARLLLALFTVFVLSSLLALTTGCSREHYEERGKADAPVSGSRGEDSAAEVYNSPDGFGNLATKCVGKGKRGYTTTRSFQSDGDKNDDIEIIPAHAIIVDDPQCTGGR